MPAFVEDDPIVRTVRCLQELRAALPELRVKVSKRDPDVLAVAIREVQGICERLLVGLELVSGELYARHAVDGAWSIGRVHGTLVRESNKPQGVNWRAELHVVGWFGIEESALEKATSYAARRRWLFSPYLDVEILKSRTAYAEMIRRCRRAAVDLAHISNNRKRRKATHRLERYVRALIILGSNSAWGGPMVYPISYSTSSVELGRRFKL